MNQKSNNIPSAASSSTLLKKEVQIPKESKSLLNKQTTTNRHVSQPKPKVPTVITATTATDIQTNNILPPKPFLKFQSINPTNVAGQANLNVNSNNAAPSLFHPSKINMSSTPIKTNINGERETNKGEDTLFENDTPIKGHKLKYISNVVGGGAGSKAIASLAERYFTKVDDQILTKKAISNQANIGPVIYNRGNQPYLSAPKTYNQTDSNQLNGRVYYKDVLKNNHDMYKKYENKGIYEPSYNPKNENIK